MLYLNARLPRSAWINVTAGQLHVHSYLLRHSGSRQPDSPCACYVRLEDPEVERIHCVYKVHNPKAVQ
jgi:hypothetical protein